MRFEFEVALDHRDAEAARFQHLTQQHRPDTPSSAGPAARFITSSAQESYIQSRQRVLQRAGKHSLVCRHWLGDVCTKGDGCDYLHSYDVSRLPSCQSWSHHGHCIAQQVGLCPFGHPQSERPRLQNERAGDLKWTGNIETIGGRRIPQRIATHAGGVGSTTSIARLECAMYFLGFCKFGSRCRLQHTPRAPTELPDIVPDWFLQSILAEPSSIPAINPNDSLLLEKLSKVEVDIRAAVAPLGQGGTQDVSAHPIDNESFWLKMPMGIPLVIFATPGLDRIYQEIMESSNPCSVVCRPDAQGRVPLRAFVIKSLQMRNVYLSVQLGIWATGRQKTQRLERAFLTSDLVILLFSANESGGFQGYARMSSVADPSLYPNVWGPFSNRLGSNFRVQWLKQCRVEFEHLLAVTGRPTQPLPNPLNEDKPIKKSRDGQEYTAGLAVTICRKLAAAPDVDILQGTDLEGKPAIDHNTFFKLTPSEMVDKEVQLTLRPRQHVPTTQLPQPMWNTSTRQALVGTTAEQPVAAMPMPPPPPPLAPGKHAVPPRLGGTPYGGSSQATSVFDPAWGVRRPRMK